MLGSGKVPAKKIYDDEKAFAILDKNPAVEGHILLLPKEHYQLMPQVPSDVLDHLFRVAQSLSRAQLKAFGVQGISLFVANGTGAGQRAPHFIIHLIPRKEHDNIGLNLPQGKQADMDYDEVTRTLAPFVKEMLHFERPLPLDANQEPVKLLSDVRKDSGGLRLSNSVFPKRADDEDATQEENGEEKQKGSKQKNVRREDEVEEDESSDKNTANRAKDKDSAKDNDKDDSDEEESDEEDNEKNKEDEAQDDEETDEEEGSDDNDEDNSKNSDDQNDDLDNESGDEKSEEESTIDSIARLAKGWRP